MRRYLADKGLGDLDVVAEDAVVADLEGADAGLLLLLGLDGQQRALTAVQNIAQAVDLRVGPGADELALADGDRGIVDDGLVDALGPFLQRVDLRGELF